MSHIYIENDLRAFQDNIEVSLGYNAFDRIKEIHNKISIIAVTARAMKEDVEKIKKHGFNACVTKPIDEDLLIENIRRYIK